MAAFSIRSFQTLLPHLFFWLLPAVSASQDHASHFPPLVERSGAMAEAALRLREGKTHAARQVLEKLRRQDPNNAEIVFQIARSYLADFYRESDAGKRRLALALAMENLQSTLNKNPDHVPALRAKALIHARAELLFYDPNLSYELASRAAKLEPHNHGFLLNLSEWMSGEVRFSQETGHRVPHDPLLGLDRSYDIIDRVLDEVVPYSVEESAALFLMGNTLARRGSFTRAIHYYHLGLSRNLSLEQRSAMLRELGASYYRTGNYTDAAKYFYEALQIRPNSIDQWLLKVSLDQLKEPLPPLPASVRFPAADPAPPHPLLVFEDIAEQSGLRRLNGNGTVAFGDLDQDGDLDLVVCGSGTFLVAYRNEKGKFVDATSVFGLEKIPSGYSLNLVDYDNDGWLDLYVSLNGWSGPMPNRLFRNNRGRFVDVSKQSGLDDGGSGFISLWGDLDNDGWLDCVIANGVLKDGSVPQIYQNLRDGRFRNVTREAGLEEPPGWGAIGLALADYDKDGRLDIFINGLNEGPNRLYHNEGAMRFRNVTRQAGVEQPPHNGFVAFFFDYNNDAWPDLLTTSLAPWDVVVEGLKKGFAPSSPRAIHPDSTRLFRNNGDGTFQDVTYAARLFYPMGTMGAGLADVDNDGFVDLYFGTGDPQLTRLEPNRFFRNNGDGTFTDLTSSLGFARPGNKGHGVAFADLDEDGDLEIFAQLGGHYPGDHAYNALYRNLRANQNHWLAVELRGIRSNRYAIGAKLTLRAGGQTLYREVKGSEGFGATNPYRQHFGLGAATRVEQLTVEWPSGVIQSQQNLKPNQVIVITETAAAR
ncbi:MAG: FG-GAP-like repeat-containing protein [Bryobacteraceae bacterium]|nr:FG-GAP-like repeat-containing protein [Bryobacteraceae bacterium]MDW8378241.1 FG-GAP-like repeat-containing protein [Bryobacterales bacterium]